MIDAITAEIIAKKYYKQIYSFCYSNLFCDEYGASEVTQEVFLFFQEQRETLENTNIQAWLYKVAKNKMGEYIRANKKYQKKFAELTEFSATVSDSEIFVHIENDVNVDDEEILKRKEFVLKALSKRDRMLYKKIYVENKTYKEIAKELNELGREVIFLGDGVPVFREQLARLMKVPYSFAPANMNRQHAAAVAVLGMQLYQQGKAESASAHKPEYLRVSQAERERNDTIVIRKMEEQDLAEVAKLEEENFSMPWSVDSFRELVSHPDALYLVAIDRDRVCGTCGVRNISGEGEVTNVVIREEYRGSGLGQKLLTELLRQGAEMGIEAFTLEVRKSNAIAIHVYEKLGFVSEGIRPHFYEKPDEDAVIMWRR